jgi:hypothetical protein
MKAQAEESRKIEDTKRKTNEEQQSRETIPRTTKPCPGCGSDIEKKAGCDHMTCKFKSDYQRLAAVILQFRVHQALSIGGIV